MVSERTPSERTYKRWGANSWAIARVFVEYQDQSLSLDLIYQAVRSIYLNLEGLDEEKFTRGALRAVLWRFKEKGYLSVRHPGGPKSTPIYRLTGFGKKVVEKAWQLHRKWVDEEDERTDRKAGHGRVSWPNLRKNDLETGLSEQHVHVSLVPWSEVVDWEGGWPEKKWVYGIRFTQFQANQIRNHIDGPSQTPAGWMYWESDQVTLKISKKGAVNIYVGNHKWRDELNEFLLDVPHISDDDLDLMWNKIARAADHMNITREFHITDPEIGKAEWLFRKKIHHRPQRRNISNDCRFLQVSRPPQHAGGGDYWYSETSGRYRRQLRNPSGGSRPLREPVCQEIRESESPDAKRIRPGCREDPRNSGCSGRSSRKDVRGEVLGITGGIRETLGAHGRTYPARNHGRTHKLTTGGIY